MQATRRARLGRRGPRALLVAALVVALIGCAADDDPTNAPDASGAPPPTIPSLPASTAIPFSPAAYPADGDAPCDEAAVPDSATAPYTGNLKRIRAEEALTVVFELCRPDVAFRARLAHPSFGITDSGWLASQLGADDGTPAILSVMNGTGPYRFEVWHGGSDLSFVRNPSYWSGTAEAERLVFTWRESPADRLGALRDGSVDGIDDLRAEDISAAIDLGDIAIATRPGLDTLYLGMNDRYAPYDSELVRRAIAIGLDRADIVEGLFLPGSALPSHMTSCVIEFGCAGSVWLQYDPLRAKELLVEAGYPDGLSTTLRYPTEPREYLPDPAGTAALIREQLLVLGIDATLEAVPVDTLIADAEAGRLDGLHLLGVRPRIADVSAVLEPRFGASASDEFGDQHAEIVAALDAGAASVDPAEREAAYGQANAGLRLLAPAVPIAHPATAAAFLADVTDAVASPTGTEWFAAMTPGDRRQLVWQQATEPASLFCADETEVDALRACAQVVESLYGYAIGGAMVEPRLATACQPDEALITWTCALRPDIEFHDGSSLDATDVLDSIALQWDVEHPLHRGRTGAFETFARLFGGHLNPPATGG
jgi:peptide/nickel transport system substrate-binding protein